MPFYTKKQYWHKSGFTLIELVVVIAVLAILFGIMLVIVNPEQQFKKARDAKRLSNLNVLAEAIQEYHLDNGTYPDSADTTRFSTVSAVGGSLSDSTGGWIDVDLSKFMPVMYIDPVNDATYYYSYRHDGVGFEIDATLESYLENGKNTSDGGNNDNKLEMGNKLTVLD